MFCDGKTPCPVCGRKYAHLSDCKVPALHQRLDELITSALKRDYTIEDLFVEVMHG